MKRRHALILPHLDATCFCVYVSVCPPVDHVLVCKC
jgi:hypothetical protein